jgi:hypothetical protein
MPPAGRPSAQRPRPWCPGRSSTNVGPPVASSSSGPTPSRRRPGRGSDRRTAADPRHDGGARAPRRGNPRAGARPTRVRCRGAVGDAGARRPHSRPGSWRSPSSSVALGAASSSPSTPSVRIMSIPSRSYSCARVSARSTGSRRKDQPGSPAQGLSANSPSSWNASRSTRAVTAVPSVVFPAPLEPLGRRNTEPLWREGGPEESGGPPRPSQRRVV